MDTEINEPHINKRGAKIIRLGMIYDNAEVIALGETLVHLSDDRIINFDDISWDGQAA
tara:strand:- start:35 stop:208 length:174 start_codon:yes stop_codon:yes gene_type:complete